MHGVLIWPFIGLSLSPKYGDVFNDHLLTGIERDTRQATGSTIREAKSILHPEASSTAVFLNALTRSARAAEE
jgi:hypothetical protein